MFKNFCLLLFTFFSISAHADTAAMKRLALKAIQYLSDEQKQTTQGTDFYQGEWPSNMMNDEAVPGLGPTGKVAYDSNCFTPAAIHNILAFIYTNHSELEQIPPMLKSASKVIEEYRDPDTNVYGFWRLSPFEWKSKTIQIRKPNHYALDSNFVQRAANVPADADDTAVALLARKLDKRLGLSKEDTPEIGEIFSKYRDRFRKNVKMYNVVYGFNVFTSAFMTWFHKEPIINPLEVVPKKNFSPYVPFGANEVDCVVNANVLTTLANYHELSTEGVEDACGFINRSIENDSFARCGVYYPNRYEVHYAVAKAIEAGVTCLEPSRNLIIDDILRTQMDDGGWQSRPSNDVVERIARGLNRKFVKVFKPEYLKEAQPENLVGVDRNDRLQASLYALNALLRLNYSYGDQPLVEAMRFILKSAVEDDHSAHWPAGLFFSGGTIIRNDIRWRSEAYTTALAADTIFLYLDQARWNPDTNYANYK